MTEYTLEQWATISQIAVAILTLFGAPIAVVLFLRERYRERRDRMNDIYLRASDRYAEFLILMLSHVDTGVYLHGDDEVLETELDKRRSILFELVTQMLEDAFLVYHSSTGAQRKRQWEGWRAFMSMYCDLPAYRDWWEQRSGDIFKIEPGYSAYDLEFEGLIVADLKRAKLAALAATP